MTNNLALPLLALLLAVLAALFPFGREDRPPPVLRQRVLEIREGSVLSALVLLLFTIATLVWPSTFAYGSSLALALSFGVLVGAISAATDAGRGGFAFGLAVLGASLLHLGTFSAAAIGASQVAFVTGTFVAAFATGGLRPKMTGGYLCSVSALAIVAVDFLGREMKGVESASSAGVALGLAFLVSSVLTGILGRFVSELAMRSLFGLFSLAIVGFVACSQYLSNSDLGNVWLGGVVVGGVVHLLLMGDTEPEPFRFVLSTVIWLGAATVAFGVARDYGMAVLVLAGVAAVVLLGNVRALMTLSVAAAILIYRLFRQLYPDEARALDIGQHYTMIGIAIGALIPLLPIEWARGRSLTGWRAMAALTIWLVILLGLPVGATILLGSKGAIGMVVGLSFAAVIESLRGAVSLAPVGLATGLGCLTVLSYSWLGDWSDLERNAKVRAVIFVAVAATLLAAALFGLSRTQASAPEKK
jgi:hypothetical protein